MKRARVLVPLAEGFEEIEAVTVVDILRRAGVEVTTAGLTEGPIKGSRGVIITPDTALHRIMEDEFDMVVLPGGLPGTTNLRLDKRIHDIVRRIHARKGYVTAICAAPSIYAELGFLEGRKATSHPSVAEEPHFKGVDYSDERVVVDGHFITSRAPGTAMEFAMTLVEALAGPEMRDKVNKGVMARL
ncbi:MAG: DJ-1/PfpI family protein [Nitrospirae bacterium]|nr:DJ-1/PfpI family protein [Nitrospirota bacterium]